MNPDLHRPGWPVIEIFGPTIQGEGPEAGLPASFVRFGGCDYRCSWCDSMHAVEPAQVRLHARRMNEVEITEDLLGLAGYVPPWVILSGGNPALLHLGKLVTHLHSCGFNVAVETQGSLWRPWLRSVDRLVVSPKPPSAGMGGKKRAEDVWRFMGMAVKHNPQALAVKVVVADEDDYVWARAFLAQWPQLPAYLSACTPVDDDEVWDSGRLLYDEHVKLTVGQRYQWLVERASQDPDMHNVRILPQLHVVAWGTRVGV